MRKWMGDRLGLRKRKAVAPDFGPSPSNPCPRGCGRALGKGYKIVGKRIAICPQCFGKEKKAKDRKRRALLASAKPGSEA